MLPWSRIDTMPTATETQSLSRDHSDRALSTEGRNVSQVNQKCPQQTTFYERDCEQVKPENNYQVRI